MQLFSNGIIGATPETAKAAGLGQGVLTPNREFKALVLSENFMANKINSDNIEMRVDLVETQAEFLRELSVSVEGKTKLFGVSGSLSAQLSQTYKTSRKSLCLLLAKPVVTSTYAVNVYQPRQTVVDDAKTLPISNFISRWGDRFVRSVTFGGMLQLIYKFDFSSEDAMSDFKLALGISGTGGSLDVNVHERIVRTAQARAVQIIGFASGVKKAPNVFTSSTADKHTTPAYNANDKQVGILFEYFNKFERLVAQNGGGSPLMYELASMYSLEGFPGEPSNYDLGRIERLKRRGLEIKSQLELATVDLNYVANEGLKSNPTVTYDKVKMEREKIEAQEKLVKAELDYLPGLTRVPRKHLFDSLEPTRLPSDWVYQTGRLWGFAEWSASSHETQTAYISIPLAPVGRQFYVHRRLSGFGGTDQANLAVWIEYADGQRERFEEHFIPNNTNTYPPNAPLIMKDGMRQLVLVLSGHAGGASVGYQIRT